VSGWCSTSCTRALDDVLAELELDLAPEQRDELTLACTGSTRGQTRCPASRG